VAERRVAQAEADNADSVVIVGQAEMWDTIDPRAAWENASTPTSWGRSAGSAKRRRS
jgi:hypothetical protein